MAEVFSAPLATPWLAGATLWGAPVVTPWGAGSQVWSTGGAYTPPPAPPGGTPTAPSTAARISVTAANSYNLVHALEVRDLRDNALLQLEQLSISIDRDSMLWTLRAGCGTAVFDKLKAGTQPPRVRVTVDGLAWEFVVELVTRTRRFPAADYAIEGRSLAAAAGAPYQPEQLWAVEGDTTAAQIAAVANLYTGLDVQWQIDDWLVPAGVFSFTGTPAGVLRRVADAAGAMALANRTGYGVAVRPRYALLPNEWPQAQPDLELPLQLVESEGFTVDAQPPYDGVVVAGQQGGVVGLVRLEGTTGAHQAPMVTDELITDLPAARQRGQAVLGRAGMQQLHTLTLPVPQVGGQGVVAEPGWLLRLLDTPAPWVALVTGVRLDVNLPTVTQTLTLEQHVESVPGTVTVPPPESVLAFAGPIPDVEVATGGTVNVALAGYWAGGEAPRSYSLRSGTLPAWLSLNASTGVLTGTAPAEPGEAELAVRATDALNSTADSNLFAVAVVPPAPSVVAISLARFDGVDGQTSGIIDEGTSGGTWGGPGLFLSNAAPFAGATALRCTSGVINSGHTPASTVAMAAGEPMTVEWRARVPAVADPLEELQTLNLEVHFSLGRILLTRLYATSDADVGSMLFTGPGGAFAVTSFAHSAYVHQAISVDAAGAVRFWLNGALVGTAPGAVVAPLEYFYTWVSSPAHPTGVFVDNFRLRRGFAYTEPFTPDLTI